MGQDDCRFDVLQQKSDKRVDMLYHHETPLNDAIKSDNTRGSGLAADV